MRTIKLTCILWTVAAAWLQFEVKAEAQSFTAFGLTNTPIGDATITFENRTMVVTAPGGIDYDTSISAASAGISGEGSWGVSVQLGEADAGIFVYPYHHGYVNDGDSLHGRVLGNVDDQDDRDVCSVRARRESEGNHSVRVDFSPIGATRQVFEVFSGERLVRRHTNEGGAVIIHTYSQSGPRVNPFWRLRDGSIAAVVELSESESMTLPNDVEAAQAWGNRLIVRPVAPAREVKFVTQVDVTGGGGLDHFLITQMRPGVFNHPHIALDSTLLSAAEGKLAVTNPDFGSNSSQHAVAIELEGLNRFDVDLSPVELGTDGAAMVASIVGRVNRVEGEFVGYAGVRHSNGVIVAFASLPVLQSEMEIAVYRDGCLAGTAQVPISEALVPLSGAPKAVGFGATANGPQEPPGLGIRLDRTTTFRLPNGTTEIQGDEIRFRAPGPFAIEKLSTFVLCASELPAFTICGETTPQTIPLHDFLADWTPDISIKLFTDRDAGTFQRTVTKTNRQGLALVQVNTSYASSNVVSEFYSFQGGDLFLHGSTAGAVDQFSAAGVRWLPRQIQLGQTYLNSGSFAGYLAGSGESYAVTVTNRVRAAGYDTLDLPAGTFTALRLESVTSSSFSTASNNPVLMSTQTNWLVPGIGLIKTFSTLQDGTFVGSGELTAYNILTAQPRDQVANIGASISFGVSVNAPFDHPGGEVSYRWLRNGVPLAIYSESLSIQNVQSADMGSYSVVVSNAAGVVTSDAGSLRVVPFSEPGCFWATRAGGTLSGHGHSVFSEAIVTDGSGNLYVAGSFAGIAAFGATTLTSAGGYDVFLAKLDSSGQYLWARRTGGKADEFARAIDLDAAGNLYLAGNFDGAAAFDAIALNSQGGNDVFVAKTDSNGNYLWAVRAGGSSTYERATDLTVDSDGNVHVIGTFSGTGDFGGFTLSADNSALFLAKLNANGDFLRARSIDHAAPGALDSGPAGSVYLTGTLYQPATFGTEVITPGRFGAAGFLSKLDADDEFVWTRKLGDAEGSHDVAVDTAGNVYVTGAISDTATLGKIALSGGNRYYSQGFLTRLDANGNFLWASKTPGGWLAVDSAGDAYVFGSFYGTLETSLATFLSYFSTGSTPLLVSKVDARGRTHWIRQFGGDYSRAIAVDPAGSVYLAGSFSRFTRFGNFILTSTDSQYNNLFVAKMCGPTPPTITVAPQSLAVDAGSNATFTVTATGATPLTYQWRKDGVNIAGATGESLTLTNVQKSDEGDYTVVLDSGGVVVVSGVATLTIISPYAGTLAFGAVNYQISEAGVVAVIDVRRTVTQAGLVTVDFGTDNDTALAAHDYIAASGTLRFGDGESVATFSVPILDDPLFESDETIVLRLCRPTGGAVLAGADTATLTVTDNDPPSPVILSQPRSRAVAQGESVAFRVRATGMTPLYYQWLKDGIEITGAGDPTYVISSVQPGDVGVYSVIVSNAAGIVISDEVALTILPPPVILEHPQSQTVVRGHSVTLSVVATSVNTSTQSLARAATGPREDRFLITTAGGEGRLVIHYDFFIVPDSLRIYRGGAQIFDTGFTNGSGSATIFYGPTPYSHSEDLEIVVNEGDTSNAITAWGYEVFLVPETLHYEWRKDGVLIPGANRPTLNIYYARVADAGQYTVTVRDRNGSVTSQPAMLTVVAPSPPTLQVVRRSDGQIQFSWEAQNFYLEEAETVQGPWYYYSSDYRGVLIEPVDYWRFYRLRENFSE
jgi:hypothetical protein